MSLRDVTTGRTAPTDGDEDVRGLRARVPHLFVVLDGDDPHAGSERASLHRRTGVTIGRGAHRGFREVGSAELRLDLQDRRASAVHARIERAGDRFDLVDAGSTNGTWLNGRRLDRATLAPGDVVRIGHTCLLFGEDTAARPPPASSWAFPTLSGELATELARLERIATTPVSVLLLGETGTGKEILARAIHARSGRQGPCIGVNCGALPESLLEAHLFGHQRGAFSGAVREEVGFVRAADEGSLLLDEIADLPLGSQAALLRVMQEGEVTPVGAVHPVKVSVRFLAATHQPLERMVADGRFRPDLFARVAGFTFSIPPLRERLCDLGLLVGALLDRALNLRIRPEVIERWLAYGWPLNIRELAQCLATSSALAADGTVRLEHLPTSMRSEAQRPPAPKLPPGRPLSPADLALRQHVGDALTRAGGNVSAVARELGKTRQQIQRWIRRFGLPRTGGDGDD